MSINSGFKDTRNAAELILSPGRPAGRTVASFGTLKLNIGGLSKLPGAISKVTDITGPIRASFGAVLKQKTLAESLTASFSSSLRSFATSSFASFSSLRPGEISPASFQAQIAERKAQLQALNARLSSTFTGASFKGVSIQENFSKTTYPLADELGLSSIPRLAQGGAVAQADSILKDKRRFAVAGVPIGTGKPSFWSRLLSAAQVKAIPTLNPVVNQVFKDRRNSSTWSEPASPYAATFPYNKVQQTESGHVIELDDTPGAERVHVFHRSGSFIEMHPNGTVVYKNLRDNYDLTMGDKYVKVSGSCHISVDGNATIHAKGNVDLQSDSDINMQAKKDFNLYAQNINLRAKKTFRGDGTTIDLRYIKLPSSLIAIPMGGGFAPRVSLAAIVADYPRSNILTSLQRMARNPLDPKNANVALSLNATSVPIPPENPLSNPGIYTKKTAAAIAYRARLFDTPEEAGNFELYSAHVELQKTLGDTGSSDPRQLGGKLVTLDLQTSSQTPSIDYLNFDTFKGNFGYANDFVLGSTSFRLRDLVDLSLYPGVVEPLKAVPTPLPDTSIPEIIITDPRVPDSDDEDEEEDGNAQWSNRLSVIKSVDFDYPGLIEDDPEAFVDQCAHRLNRLDGHKKWGRKARNADGSNLNDDALTYQLDASDYSKKKLIDIIIGVGEPGASPSWQLRPSYEEPDNGYWAPPATADRDQS